MSNTLESISIYAQSVDTHGEGDQVNVFLKNIDISQVIQEFNAEKVLDAMSWETIVDYVSKKQTESDDE